MEKFLADHVAVCADQADLCPELFFQHMLDQITGSRFAAGSGDADDRHLPGGIAVEVAAGKRQRKAAVLHLHIRRPFPRDILAEDDRRALFKRSRNKLVAVGRKALDGDKQIARAGLAGIIADSADLRIHIRRSGEIGDILQKLR